MSLLSEWRDYAYGLDDRTPEGKQFWLNYFGIEKDIYIELLTNPNEIVKGTVKELAEKYNTTISIMTGFLDGIEESLVKPNDIENMEEDTVVSLEFDKEKLYMNMIGCEAEWLYTLPEWDNLIDENKRKELYKAEKISKTVVKPAKIGRNEPCPCGSGKKYKQCCGRN